MLDPLLCESAYNTCLSKVWLKNMYFCCNTRDDDIFIPFYFIFRSTFGSGKSQDLTIFLRKLWKNSYFDQFKHVYPTQLTYLATFIHFFI